MRRLVIAGLAAGLATPALAEPSPGALDHLSGVSALGEVAERMEDSRMTPEITAALQDLFARSRNAAPEGLATPEAFAGLAGADLSALTERMLALVPAGAGGLAAILGDMPAAEPDLRSYADPRTGALQETLDAIAPAN